MIHTLSPLQIEDIARDLNSVKALVQNLCRFAYRAEDNEDFAAFHGLLFDLLPQIGLRLDQVSTALGDAPSGNFVDGTVSRMYSA